MRSAILIVSAVAGVLLLGTGRVGLINRSPR